MAKKSTKRQEPSKPQTLKGSVVDELKEDRAATGGPAHTDGNVEENTTAGGDGDRPRTKEEIEAGKKKGQYEVLDAGVTIGSKLMKMGDTVTMTADEAANHRERGVALAGPKG